MDQLIVAKKEIKFKLDHKKSKRFSNLTPLQKLILQAARTNNASYLQHVSNEHFALDFNYKDQKGRTPLFIAVENKNIEAVCELLKCGADVNIKCTDGNTCLHRLMICQDGDPRTELLINLLLTNCQYTKKQMQTRKKYHEKKGSAYQMLMLENRANLKNLNDMNKTALYYASKPRTGVYAWKNEVVNVIDQGQISYGDLKSPGDRRMKALIRKVKREEDIKAAVEARRRKNKVPNSLSMKQEEEARIRFEANRLKRPVNAKTRDIIDIVNIDGNGRVNADIYTHYDKLIRLEKKRKSQQVA